MLNTLADIKNDVLVKLAQNTTQAFFTDTILGDWINEAYSWAAGYRKWPATEGRVSTTFASLITAEDGDLRGEFPEGWKSDSIRHMFIDGKEVKKLEYRAYRKFRELFADSSDRVFTDYGRLYYVNPNIDISGTVVLFGQFWPIPLDKSVPGSTTVFSGSEEEANEAIAEKVLGFARQREHLLNEARNHDARASQILNEVWERVQEEQYGYEDHDATGGMFERIDVLRGAQRDDLLHRKQWY